MAFFLSRFLSKIENDNIIFFNNIENGETKQIAVNKQIIDNHTDFFKEKEQFIVDSVYTVPFDIDLAIESIEHLQTIFVKLGKSENIFKLLVAYDYFCVPVKDVYEHVFETSNFTDQQIRKWSIQVCNEYPTDLSLYLLNKLYDVYYKNSNLYNLIWSPSKEVIFFLLKRKWVSDTMDRESFVKKATQLEFYLAQTVFSFIDFNIKEKDQKTETVSTFMEMWSLLHYDYLAKDMLMSISNNEISQYILAELSLIISKRMGFFHREINNKIDSLFYTKSRFMCPSLHLEESELKIDSKIQIMDNRKRWYNGEIIKKTDLSVRIHFEQFSDRYDEDISLRENYRFLPYGTLQKDKICPCETCIRDLKILIQL